MSELRLQHAITKGAFRLDVDTTIPSRGITGVFGESGSGKTTLLRCIAGLDASVPTDPRPVHKRRIGYVFQEPRLFAHLSVRRNIEYGLRRSPDSAIPVAAAARMFGLESLLDRTASGLSGGEAQRVAIARVVCQAPELILMDEPLSALDERRRDDLLPYLDRLHSESLLPIVYVSHNIDEICRLCDHLLLLDEGRLAASGRLVDVLARIDLPQLAGRNAGTVIEATPARYDEKFDLTTFEFSGGAIRVPGRFDVTSARLRIQASDVSLTRQAATATTILNILPARIESCSDETSSTVLLRLRAGDDALIARITRRSFATLGLEPGDDLYAQIKSVTVRR